MKQPCPILHTSVMNRSILAKYSSSQSHFPVKCEHKFSDVRFVADAGMDGILCVRDRKSRQVQRTFDKPAHKVAVTSLAFSLRGKATACGSVDGKLILCNAVTGQGCSPLQTSSHQALNRLQFSHHCRNLLAAASDDYALCTWDSGTKNQLCRFETASGGHSVTKDTTA